MHISSQVKLLRISQVIERTGLKRPTIYQHIQKGLFPIAVKFGPKLAAWPEHEVANVINARIAGMPECEIKALVEDLVSARGENNAS